MRAGKLRIGFIGAGANTRKMHIPGFCKLPEVELSVVANRTLASSERVAKQEGIKRVAQDWRAVVEDPAVDAARSELLFAKAGSTEEKKNTLGRTQCRGWQVEANFVRSIREGAPVRLTSFAQGLRYMRFTEMVAASLAGSGQRVNWADFRE